MSEINENQSVTQEDMSKCNGEKQDTDQPEIVNEELNEEEGGGEHYWFSGQTAFISGLTDRTDLNGRYGYVLETESEDRKIDVRVNLPGFQTETVRLERANMRFVAEEDEPRVDVIWLYTRRLNTGQRGGIAEVMADAYVAVGDEENSVCQISCTETELHECISRMQFDRVPTPFLERVGVRIACFARPHAGAADEGLGRDNVLASYVAASFADEHRLKVRNIVGTTFLIRLSPTTGDIVNFPHDEMMRILMFINDISDIRRGEPGVFTDDVLDTFAACLPFYDLGCRMTLEGFVGLNSMRRLDDGSFSKEPEDMAPVSTHPR